MRRSPGHINWVAPAILAPMVERFGAARYFCASDLGTRAIVTPPADFHHAESPQGCCLHCEHLGQQRRCEDSSRTIYARRLQGTLSLRSQDVAPLHRRTSSLSQKIDRPPKHAVRGLCILLLGLDCQGVRIATVQARHTLVSQFFFWIRSIVGWVGLEVFTPPQVIPS